MEAQDKIAKLSAALRHVADMARQPTMSHGSAREVLVNLGIQARETLEKCGIQTAE